MRVDGQIKDGLVARCRALLDRKLAELVRADEELDVSEASELGDVADAIERFDTGTYGRCVACSREIGAKRLKAMPVVALCFACAAHETYDTIIDRDARERRL